MYTLVDPCNTVHAGRKVMALAQPSRDRTVRDRDVALGAQHARRAALKELKPARAVIATSGPALDRSTPHGRMMATIILTTGHGCSVSRKRLHARAGAPIAAAHRA
jgi:hypothetical protein